MNTSKHQGPHISGKVKVSAFTISLDGYGAGPGQSKEFPMGRGTEQLHQWMFETKMFQKMLGKEGGVEGTDNDMAEKSMENVGAWIMGRNMFGPVRGPWPNEDWKGWWGENPPYHVPVFVLSHHARNSIEMKGETTFHFITEGIEVALEKAKAVAGGKDIRIGGGTSTIRQFLQSGFIDELHIAISPVFIGSGEHLLSGMDMRQLGFNQIKKIDGEKACHFILTKDKPR